MGVSGGAVVGYFTFAYEGYPPHARILTRNTFDPWDTLLSRLGVAQNIHQTATPERAVAHLVPALEEGAPALVHGKSFWGCVKAAQWSRIQEINGRRLTKWRSK